MVLEQFPMVSWWFAGVWQPRGGLLAVSFRFWFWFWLLWLCLWLWLWLLLLLLLMVLLLLLLLWLLSLLLLSSVVVLTAGRTPAQRTSQALLCAQLPGASAGKLTPSLTAQEVPPGRVWA